MHIPVVVARLLYVFVYSLIEFLYFVYDIYNTYNK